jgi:hypothetical protein
VLFESLHQINLGDPGFFQFGLQKIESSWREDNRRFAKNQTEQRPSVLAIATTAPAGAFQSSSNNPATITASHTTSTFNGSPQGGLSTPFGTVDTGAVSGITLIMAA